MTFSSLFNFQGSGGIQGGNPFLSGITGPLTPRSSATVAVATSPTSTAFSPMLASSSFSQSQVTYTSTTTHSPISIQPLVTSMAPSPPPPQQQLPGQPVGDTAPVASQQLIITTSLPEGSLSAKGINLGTLSVLKPSPNKQGQAH